MNLHSIVCQASQRDTSRVIGILSYKNQGIERMFLHELLGGYLYIRFYKKIVEHGGELYRLIILGRGEHPATSSFFLHKAVENTDIVRSGKVILYVSIQRVRWIEHLLLRGILLIVLRDNTIGSKSIIHGAAYHGCCQKYI